MNPTRGRKRKASIPLKITAGNSGAIDVEANTASNAPSEDVLKGGGYVFSKQSVVSVLQDLECAVCKDIQGEEVVRSCCANAQCTVINYICKKHTEGPAVLNQNRCLMCQTTGVTYDPDKAVSRLLSSVFVDCPKEGCSTRMTASQLKQHLERECEKNVIKCGETRVRPLKASQDHAADCRSRKCFNHIEDPELGSFGCTWEGNVVDLPNHDYEARRLFCSHSVQELINSYKPIECLARSGGRASSPGQMSRQYMLAVRNFSADERSRLRSIINSSPRLRARAWKFVKVASFMDFAFPYTLNDVVVLPSSFLAQHDESEAAVTLLHESFHIDQRAHQPKFDKFYERKWGYVRPKRLTIPGSIWKRTVTDPDAPDIKWVKAMNGAYWWTVLHLPDERSRPIAVAYMCKQTRPGHFVVTRERRPLTSLKEYVTIRVYESSYRTRP
ncbi:hypothetical protein KFL_011810010, partial [Klebsormidium nitens]